MLDAYAPDKLGGTGETFNWDLALEARGWGRPIFLAGGLTPENVAEAVRRVRPYGVDVSSGVEAAPGRKDHAKVRAFIQAAKAVAGLGLEPRTLSDQGESTAMKRNGNAYEYHEA